MAVKTSGAAAAAGAAAGPRRTVRQTSLDLPSVAAIATAVSFSTFGKDGLIFPMEERGGYDPGRAGDVSEVIECARVC